MEHFLSFIIAVVMYIKINVLGHHIKDFINWFIYKISTYQYLEIRMNVVPLRKRC